MQSTSIRCSFVRTPLFVWTRSCGPVRVDLRSVNRWIENFLEGPEIKSATAPDNIVIPSGGFVLTFPRSSYLVDLEEGPVATTAW